MAAGFLYILCGVPYAGKSTLTNALVKRCGFKIASMDAVMDELDMHSDTMSQEDWNKVSSIAYERLKDNLMQGFTVVLDSGSLKRSERDSARRRAAEAGAESRLIYINTSKEEAKARWIKNADTLERDQLTDTTMNKAFGMFEEPTADENPIIYNQSMDLESWISENIHL